MFVYRQSNGTERRELRHPDDVFHADSLASLADAPVTVDHPSAGAVTAENARELARGHLVGTPTRDGRYLRAQLLVTDAAAIATLESGSRREVSLGYSVDLDETPGEYQGERYDARQKNITYNHVALVPQGRAGAECRVRMDAAVQERSKMATVVRIDSVEYSVEEPVARHITALEAERDERRSVQRVDADFRAAVRARANLERIAGATLRLDKFGSMSDEEIKVAVIETISKVAVPKNYRSDGIYLDSRFAAALAILESRGGDKLAATIEAMERACRYDDGEGGSKAAAKKYRRALADLWKKPLSEGFNREDMNAGERADLAGRAGPPPPRANLAGPTAPDVPVWLRS